MRRISRKTIDAINTNVRISDVFEWLGETVSANRRMAFCPFCADKESRNPGCSISDDKGLYHCFVCGRGGSTIQFVEEHEGLSFHDACEAICKQFNIPVEYDDADDPIASARKGKLYRVMERMNEIFVSQRNQTPFKKFVSSRHITQEAVEEFSIGYSRSRFAKAAVDRMLETFDPKDLVNAGLCTRNQDGSLFLTIQNRVTFPIRNAGGGIVAFGGRDVTGKSKAKYRNTSETEIFSKSSILYGYDTAKRHIRSTRSVILCEGYMDTIALQTHGFGQSVGAMGTAVSRSNLLRLSKSADVMYVSLDNDAAGVDAAMRITKNIVPNMAMDVRVVTIPNDVAKDPDEFFNQQGKTSEEFEQLLENAVPIFSFCVEHLVRDAADEIAELSRSGDIRTAKTQNAIRDARLSCERRVASFMGGNWDKVDVDQRVALANIVVSSLQTEKTYSQLLDEWSRVSASDAQRMSRYEQQHDSVSASGGKKGVTQSDANMKSSATDFMDRLITALYYKPNLRNKIKQSEDVLMSAFEDRSGVRAQIFSKLNRVIAEGRPTQDVVSELDEVASSVLSGIIMPYETGGKAPVIDEGNIDEMCDEIIAEGLRKRLDHASGASDLDLELIFKLQDELNAVMQRQQNRKNKANSR